MRRKHATSRSPREPQAAPEAGLTPIVGLRHLRSPHAAALAIVVLTVVFYLPATRAGFIWDDKAVTENAFLETASGLAGIWTDPIANIREDYYANAPVYLRWPLVYTSFWFEYRLWGLRATGYHVVNILLHAMNALLVWRLLKRLGVPGCWLAAVIFALHPVHVESVAWVVERKNLLCTLFGLLSLGAWLHSMESPPSHAEVTGMPAGSRVRTRAWYAASVALFVAALLSKSSAICFPPVAILILWWRDGRVARRQLLSLAPFLLLMGIMVVSEFLVMHSHSPIRITSGPVERMLISGRAFWHYVYKFFLPAELLPIYPHWEISVSAPLQYLFPALAAALVAVAWAWRSTIGRGPVTAVLAFGICLAPTLGVADFGYMTMSFVADRFQYLADVCLVAAVAAAAARWIPPVPRIRRALAGVAILALGSVTWRQSMIYRSPEIYWRYAVERNPAAWEAQHNYGVEIAEHGRHADAIPHFEEAVKLKPDYPAAHSDLGISLSAVGRHAEAETHFIKALELHPSFPFAHNNYGVCLRAANRNAEAIVQFREAVRKKPDYAFAHNNLGKALAGTSDSQGALEHLERAVTLRPDRADFRNDLGVMLKKTGAIDEAIAQYEIAVRLDPNNRVARQNLESSLARRRAP